MNELLKKLEDWGCDIAGAMERVVDDEELYVTCLEIFLTDENFEALGTAIAEKNLDAAFEYAHALKGVAANLGLTPVYAPVSELVEILRKQADGDLAGMYQAVMAAKAKLAELAGK